MDKTLVKQMTEFLDETVQYFSENTNRRCATEASCFYNPVAAGKKGKSQGCAIGRKMTSAQKLNAPQNTHVGMLDKKYIPKSLINFPIEFLRSVQSLHDNGMNWDYDGLTSRGVEKVLKIRQEYLTN